MQCTGPAAPVPYSPSRPELRDMNPTARPCDPSLTLRCRRAHTNLLPVLPLPVPPLEPTAAAEPWITASLHAQHSIATASLNPAFTRALLYPYSKTRPQTWSVPVVVIATGPGLGSVPHIWRMQALPGL